MAAADRGPAPPPPPAAAPPPEPLLPPPWLPETARKASGTVSTGGTPYAALRAADADAEADAGTEGDDAADPERDREAVMLFPLRALPPTCT